MEKLFIDGKTVAIGGGTGLSTLLEAQTRHAPKDDFVAITTTGDNGGDYERWRRWYSVTAGGDIRKASGPLATNPYFKKVKEYRFPEHSGLFDGHSVEDILEMAFRNCYPGSDKDPIRSIISCSLNDNFLQEVLNFRFRDETQRLDRACVGNMILAVCELVAYRNGWDLNTGLRGYQRIGGVEGLLIPVTLIPTTLVGEFGLKDQSQDLIITGEDNIGHVNRHPKYTSDMVLKKISYLQPTKLNPLAGRALSTAKEHYVAMGSPYTSIIANSLADEFNDAVEQANADATIIVGLMVAPGESYHLKNASDHLAETKRYLHSLKVKRVFLNDHRGYEFLPRDIRNRYEEEGKLPIIADQEMCERIYPGAKIIVEPFAFPEPEHGWVRHDIELLGYHLYQTKRIRTLVNNGLAIVNL